MNSLRKDLPAVPAKPQLVADDATPEHLGRILAEQGERIALVSEEAGSLFGQAAGRYSKTGEANLDLYLKAYDGGSTRVGRVTREAVFLDRPAITAIVTPQPIILAEFSKHPEFQGRGFVARWLFALPPSRVGTRKYENRPIRLEAREAYHKAIGRLLELPVPVAAEIHVVHLNGVALTRWAVYQDRIEEEQRDGGRLYYIRDWASKLGAKVARIAACFHLLEQRELKTPWDVPVSEEAVLAAWSLGDYYTEHALAAYALMGADPHIALARRILGWIRRKPHRRFSKRDCHQAHRNLGKPSELDPGLEVLEARGFIRRVPPESPEGKKGQPKSPEWEVNPSTQKSQNTQKSNSEYSEYSVLEGQP